MDTNPKRQRISRLGLVWDWDLWLALIVAASVAALAPARVEATLTKDLASVSTSVLAVIFSVYFAAVAIIMSSGEDSFVKYLAHKGRFKKVLFAFKVTLTVLFLGLVSSLALYIWSAVSASLADGATISQWWLVVTSYLVAWGMFAAMETALTALKHSQLRVLFSQVYEQLQRAKDNGSDGSSE